MQLEPLVKLLINWEWETGISEWTRALVMTKGGQRHKSIQISHSATTMLSSAIATSLTMVYATLFKCTYYYYYIFFLFGLNKKKEILIKVQLFNLCTFTYLQVRISKVSHLVGFWFTFELANFFFRHKYVKLTRVLVDLSLKVGVAGLKIQIVYNFSPVKILVMQIS